MIDVYRCDVISVNAQPQLLLRFTYPLDDSVPSQIRQLIIADLELVLIEKLDLSHFKDVLGVSDDPSDPVDHCCQDGEYHPDRHVRRTVFNDGVLENR